MSGASAIIAAGCCCGSVVELSSVRVELTVTSRANAGSLVVGSPTDSALFSDTIVNGSVPTQIRTNTSVQVSSGSLNETTVESPDCPTSRADEQYRTQSRTAATETAQTTITMLWFWHNGSGNWNLPGASIPHTTTPNTAQVRTAFGVGAGYNVRVVNKSSVGVGCAFRVGGQLKTDNLQQPSTTEGIFDVNVGVEQFSGDVPVPGESGGGGNVIITDEGTHILVRISATARSEVPRWNQVLGDLTAEVVSADADASGCTAVYSAPAEIDIVEIETTCSPSDQEPRFEYTQTKSTEVSGQTITATCSISLIGEAGFVGSFI